MIMMLVAEAAGGGGLGGSGLAWWQWVLAGLAVVVLGLVVFFLVQLFSDAYLNGWEGIADRDPGNSWKRQHRVNGKWVVIGSKEDQPMTTHVYHSLNGPITIRYNEAPPGTPPTDPTLPDTIPLEEDTVLVGYRGFDLLDGVLYGSYHGTSWKGGTFSAMCGHSDDSAAQCLADSRWSQSRHSNGPGCGIYSVRKFTDLSAAHGVYASVVNFGVVVPGETGFRAQHTRIEQLWLIGEPGDWNTTVAEYLSRNYNAPCEITTLEKLWHDHGEGDELWEASASKRNRSAFVNQSASLSSIQLNILSAAPFPIPSSGNLSQSGLVVTDPTTAKP